MWKAFARAAVLGLGVWAAVAQAQTPPAQALPNLPLVVQGTVYATARQADGGLILGGDFAAIGGVARRNLARLLPNGDVDPDWQPAWTSDPVLAVAVDGTTVYAGGKATFLRAFAGATASTLWTRSTQGGYVHAFAVKDDHALFVGGGFSAIDGVAAQGLAKLDAAGAPTGWSASANDVVESLALDGDALYVGGAFTSLRHGSDAAQGPYLGRVSATSGAALGNWSTTPDDVVFALALDNDHALYVGGAFRHIGGSGRIGVAKLDRRGSGLVEAAWNSPYAAATAVRALLLDGDVYVGGDGLSLPAPGPGLPSPPANLGRLAVADGSVVWSKAVQGGVDSLLSLGNTLTLAAGDFTRIEASHYIGLAALAPDGSTTALADVTQAPGAGVQVNALLSLADGGTLVGGAFLCPGNTGWHANLIRLAPDGNLDDTWQGDTDGDVDALVQDAAGNVYAGGAFTHAGAQTRTRLARFGADGSLAATLYAVPANAAAIRALALGADGTLYLGGETDAASPAGYLARFASASGASAGSMPTPNAAVYALAWANEGGQEALYAGGAFARPSAAPTPRQGAAKFLLGPSVSLDAGWNAHLGTGSVRAVARDGSGRIYLGGSFTQANGASHPSVVRVAAADGGVDAAWLPPIAPSGIDGAGRVNAIAVAADGKVLLGGDFATAVEPALHHLVRLDAAGAPETHWRPEPGAAVNAVLGDATRVLAGGAFASVGASARLALAAVPAQAFDLMPSGVSVDAVAPEPSHVGETYRIDFHASVEGRVAAGHVRVRDANTVWCSAVALSDGAGHCDAASVHAGSQNLTLVFTADDLDVAPSSTSVAHAVLPRPASVQLAGLEQTYDGTPRVVSASTVPVGLPVSITYDGSATAPTEPGQYAVLAEISNPDYSGSTQATLVVHPGAPAAIYIEGDNQFDGVAGQPLTGALPAVRVRDQAGHGVPGVAVLFAASAGSGSVSGGDAVTDADGIARVGGWILGTHESSNVLLASAEGVDGNVQFQATGAGQAQLQVEVTAEAAYVQAGQTFAHLVSVSNAGALDASGAALSLSVAPEDFASGSFSWTCSRSDAQPCLGGNAGTGLPPFSIDVPAGAHLDYVIVAVIGSDPGENVDLGASVLPISGSGGSGSASTPVVIWRDGFELPLGAVPPPQR